MLEELGMEKTTKLWHQLVASMINVASYRTRERLILIEGGPDSPLMEVSVKNEMESVSERIVTLVPALGLDELIVAMQSRNIDRAAELLKALF
jgi:hypothetical protein